MDKPSPTPRSQHAFQAPKGTRDFYPAEQARRRFIYDAWQRVSLRHGFDEISGPTFEHLDLYTVKSGDEIVSELFSFTRAGGKRQFALRPEFTPTLARMVAARAKTLPKPIRWFSVENYFRAERPQRGRLREFAQLNIDVIGDASASADAEVIACFVELLRELGLSSDDVRVQISHRDLVAEALRTMGMADDEALRVFAMLDRRDKMSDEKFHEAWKDAGLAISLLTELSNLGDIRLACDTDWGNELRKSLGFSHESIGFLEEMQSNLAQADVLKWCDCNLFDVVRGLAYYTGAVFEVHETGGKERAIAGGGRYDKLIELFEGPPTPAVGFAMGDVVLANVLEDRGLIPEGAALLEQIGARPDIFVIASFDQGASHLAPALAALRKAGLHARRSYKATRNVGKLLKEASAAGARLAIILESEQAAQIKSLDTGEQSPSSADPDALVETVKRLLQSADTS